jgi:hypothetical protein
MDSNGSSNAIVPGHLAFTAYQHKATDICTVWPSLPTINEVWTAPLDVLTQAKLRLAEVDRQLAQVETLRTEAEQLRRMIAAAETK